MATELLERVLLIGGSGQVGSELRALLEAGGALWAPPRAELDVESADAVTAAIGAFRPTLVVNTTAYHNTEECEVHPGRAFAVNALAVDALAEACAGAGAAFATFSTDYVFDGAANRPYRESDPANPLSAYGASKLAGEHLVRRHGPRHIIVRTSGVYGRTGSSAKGYTFIDRVLTQAAEGKPLTIVSDVTFSPSYAKDVAAGFVRLAQRGAFGTFHLTNAGETTWFDFASSGFALAGLRPDVQAVSAAAFPSRVRRPAYSALENAAVKALGIEPLPDWRDGLRRYIAERAGQSAEVKTIR